MAGLTANQDFLHFLRQYTGQESVTTVEAADAVERRAVAAMQAAETAAAEANKRLRAATRKLRLTHLHLFFARLPARTGFESWLVALCCGILFAPLLAMPVMLLHGGDLLLAIAVLLPFVVLFGGMVWIFPADVRPVEDALQLAIAEYERVREMVSLATEQSRRAVADAQAARQPQEGIRKAMAEPLLRLLAVDFCTLSGDDFEDYLFQIFTYRGYEVTRTGKAGDQGVDLIATRDGVKLAIQAKCYQGSVGNEPVQEVYAGMVHYKCQRCVVMTSSYFTASAKKLAESVGCTLVEGGQLAMFVRGEFTL